jgi:hypothetical protein
MFPLQPEPMQTQSQWPVQLQPGIAAGQARAAPSPQAALNCSRSSATCCGITACWRPNRHRTTRIGRTERHAHRWDCGSSLREQSTPSPLTQPFIDSGLRAGMEIKNYYSGYARRLCSRQRAPPHYFSAEKNGTAGAERGQLIHKVLDEVIRPIAAEPRAAGAWSSHPASAGSNAGAPARCMAFPPG